MFLAAIPILSAGFPCQHGTLRRRTVPDWSVAQAEGHLNVSSGFRLFVGNRVGTLLSVKAAAPVMGPADGLPGGGASAGTGALLLGSWGATGGCRSAANRTEA